MLSGQRLLAVQVVLKMWYVNGSFFQDLFESVAEYMCLYIWHICKNVLIQIVYSLSGFAEY